MRKIAGLGAVMAAIAFPGAAGADPSVYGPELSERPTTGTLISGSCEFERGRTTCQYDYLSTESWGCRSEDSLSYEVFAEAYSGGFFVFAGNALSGEPLEGFTSLTGNSLAAAEPTPGIRPHARRIDVEEDGIHQGIPSPIGYYVVGSC